VSFDNDLGMKEGEAPGQTRRTSGHSTEPALQVICLVGWSLLSLHPAALACGIDMAMCWMTQKRISYHHTTLPSTH
jgi:hypothetical protein